MRIATLALITLAATLAVVPDAGDVQARAEVAARSPGKGVAAVRLEYRLDGKPLPGRPLGLELHFHPLQAAEWLAIAVNADPELALPNPLDERFEAVGDGAVSVTVPLMPQAFGRYYVNAVVTAGSGSDARARAFSVPIQVGGEVRTSKTRVPVAVEADGGQVVRLPVRETRSPRGVEPLPHTP